MKLSEIRKLIRDLPMQSNTIGQRQRFDYLREFGFDPSMLYQELEMESRFVDTHRDTSYSNANVSLHSHTFFEILYCLNTCGAEYLVGADRYRLRKGDIIFVPPGVSHRPLLSESMTEPYKRYVLWVSTEFMNRFQQTFPDEALFGGTGSRLIRTAGTKWEFLGDKFLQGIRETEEKAVGWEAAVAANTVQLLVQLRRAVTEKTTKPLKAEKPELLDQVLAYVEAHMAQKITLADIARQFFVSESTVTQTFRNKMGVSFYRCVTQRRLIAAKTLILDGNLLEAVSGQVGFSDYSSFYRAFKQEYGISPRQFRQLQESNDEATP